MIDYFTVAEFRAFAKDNTSPVAYEDQDILDAQDEVVNTLERWAGTAWPTIAAPLNGAVRSTTDVFDEVIAPLVCLSKRPIIAFTAVSLAGAVIVVNNDFTADLDAGIVRFAGIDTTFNPLAVAYTYGYSVTPRQVKRPVMRATKSLLETEVAKGKIPARVSQYQTGGGSGTTFVFNNRPKGVTEPWPWDEVASDAIVAYWGSERPLVFVST